MWAGSDGQMKNEVATEVSGVTEFAGNGSIWLNDCDTVDLLNPFRIGASHHLVIRGLPTKGRQPPDVLRNAFSVFHVGKPTAT